MGILAQVCQCEMSNYFCRLFNFNFPAGKTTVARIYAKFLIEFGILPDSSIVEETSGSALLNGGLNALEKMLDGIKTAKGGVVFVDEAYQLCPQEDRDGRRILDFILLHAESVNGKYGRLVWVFAGYVDRMDKLFEHNPGLPSRFPVHMKFSDYTDKELEHIFRDLLKTGGQNESVAVPVSKKEVKKPQSISMGYPQYYNQKPDETDKWGNTWTWNTVNSTFEDSYGNITGYGVENPQYPLGTTRNPLISTKDNTSWLFDSSNNMWVCQGDMTRKCQYPGKPDVIPAVSKKVNPFKVDDKWVRIAMRRLGKNRGKIGFGNARDVRNYFDLVKQRQANRLSEEKRRSKAVDVFLFERYDMLGPKASMEVLKKSEAWKSLSTMEGLEEVKNEIEMLISMVIVNAEREEMEVPLLDVNLNRVFLGNPGTGKVIYTGAHVNPSTDNTVYSHFV